MTKEGKNLSMQFGVAVLAIIMISFTAVISGTVVWLLWPVAMGAFPGLVSGGVLAAKLTWWESVCLTWLLGFLIKSSGPAAKCPKEKPEGEV